MGKETRTGDEIRITNKLASFAMWQMGAERWIRETDTAMLWRFICWLGKAKRKSPARRNGLELGIQTLNKITYSSGDPIRLWLTEFKNKLNSRSVQTMIDSYFACQAWANQFSDLASSEATKALHFYFVVTSVSTNMIRLSMERDVKAATAFTPEGVLATHPLPDSYPAWLGKIKLPLGEFYVPDSLHPGLMKPELGNWTLCGKRAWADAMKAKNTAENKAERASMPLCYR